MKLPQPIMPALLVILAGALTSGASCSALAAFSVTNPAAAKATPVSLAAFPRHHHKKKRQKKAKKPKDAKVESLPKQ